MTDRPWGMTLGALGLRGLSGQLTLAGQYKVAFQQGVVVGAFSPLANDAAVRLALTGNLITSSQVADITRRIAAAPHRDEIEVLAEICRLQPDQAQRLRRRLVAQRAARTFAIDQGEFVVEDAITVSVVPGSELDVRTIVFLGAKNNLSEDRLASELAQLGVWFKLKPQAADDLPQYGFADDDRPVVQMLVQGANLADVEYANSGLGARNVRAVAYALAACGACDASATPGPAMPRSPGSTVPPANVARTPSATVPPQTILRGTTQPPPVAQPEQKHKTAPLGSRSPSASSEPPMSRTVSSSQPSVSRTVSSSQPSVSRTVSSSQPSQPRAPTPSNPPTGVASGRVPTSHPALNTDAPASGRTPTGNSHDTATGRAVTRQSGQIPRMRSPSMPPVGRTPTPRDPVISRVGTPSNPGFADGADVAAPRTITQSSGVPREADPRHSSGANAAASSNQLRAIRSPSEGIRAADRSPSGGIPRAGTSRPSGSTMPPLSRTRTNNSGANLRPPSDPIATARTRSSQQMRAFSTTGTAAPPPGGRRGTGLRRKHSTGATLEIEALLEKKLPMLDQGVDYFTLFGLPIGASPDDVRSTYFMLARKLHPDRLAAIGIEDEDRQAQRLMACINEAFAVLNDPIRRAEYISILNRGGEAAIRAEEQKADELAMKVMRAEEEFRQGEMMLRREQIAQAVQHFTIAVELAPNEPEYQALLAWAQFAQADDKAAVAQQTRKALVRAAEANTESPTAHFYLGRVERMLGREKEALYCFYQVLKIKPNHSEATSEARILEQRLKARR